MTVCAPAPWPTPYLDLDVPHAVATYRRLAAALPGIAIHYAVKANPAPELLAALVAAGGRFDVASPAEVEPPRAPARRRTTSSTPTRSSGATTSPRRRARCPPVRRRLASARSRKVAEAAPGRGGPVPPRHLGRRLRLAAVTQVRLLHRRGRRHPPARGPPGLAPPASLPRRLPAARPERLGPPDRRRRQRLRGATRRRARPPGCSTSAAASPPGTRARPPLAAYGAVDRAATCARLRRPPAADHRRARPGDRRRRRRPGRHRDRRGPTRRHPLGLPRRRRLHRAGRDARRGDPLPHRTSADGGPTGPCVLAGPTCDSADVLYQDTPVELPLALAEGDLVRFDCAGAYPRRTPRSASTASPRLPVVHRPPPHRTPREARFARGSRTSAGTPEKRSEGGPSPAGGVRLRGAGHWAALAPAAGPGVGPVRRRIPMVPGSSAWPGRPGWRRTSFCPGPSARSATTCDATGWSGPRCCSGWPA